MNLQKLLFKKRAVLLKKWLESIFATYAPDTRRFLQSEKDMFANPVGYTITANADYILEGLIKGEDAASLSPYLEWIIRIRAVQDFSAAEVISFIGLLKLVIIDHLKKQIDEYGLWGEWVEFESRIDMLSLYAFEIYVKMKEKIYQIRIKELEKSERFLARLMEKHAK